MWTKLPSLVKNKCDFLSYNIVFNIILLLFIMIVVAIDPGIKNLGWSVYDTKKQVFISFGRYNLLKDQPKKMHTKYVHLVASFIEASRDVFDMADAVLVEMQMVAKFKVIQTAFISFFWGKSHEVSMRSVRCHFGISTGKYAANKKASIIKVPELLPVGKNRDWFSRFDHSKKDDVADAILLAMYWVQVKLPEIESSPTSKNVKKRKRRD